ncbi:MAG: DUF58 domain-containing protein [Actinomycetaceae bacterium]|nr:DUF58 domain-containing protein [Actinomycetaceae bacterium]
MVITWRASAITALGVPLYLVTNSASLALAWLGFVAALIAFDVALAPSPRTLQVSREVPTFTRLSETATSTVSIVNQGKRRLRGMLRDAWQPSAGAVSNRHAIDVLPGQRARTITQLLPTRRGERKADQVTVRSLGPLRVAGRQCSYTVDASILVLPEFVSRKHLPSRIDQLRSIEGASLLLRRGQGSEFDSLREYVQGDDVRDINWRSSARFRNPVVNTWRPERDRTVMICLDMSRVSAMRVGAAPRLDAQMETVLLLSALAAQAGDKVRVLAFDTQVRASVRAAKGPTTLNVVAKALAPLEPTLTEASWDNLSSTFASQLSQRSLVVLCTGVEGSSLSSGLLRGASFLSTSHKVVVASVEDLEVSELTSKRDTTEDIFLASAALKSLEEKREVMARLVNNGIDVVEANAEQIAPKVADHYLMLKKRGEI